MITGLRQRFFYTEETAPNIFGHFFKIICGAETVKKIMKLNPLIYFEILFNSTDLLEKTIFKNKTVEVNTVKNEGRIYKKFKRTKTLQSFLVQNVICMEKQIIPQIKEKLQGGAETKNFIMEKII